MGAFFARYVRGTEDPPLADLLATFGIDWHLRAAGGNADRGGKPSPGTSPACWLGAKVAADVTLQHVFAGSPAERAGLAARDVLVAIDGVRASAASVDALATTRAAGERITVHAFRRDELFAVDVELASAPLDTCYLVMKPDAPATAAALRQAWLHG
jgi:predicted metalloprotease with PDZ domain